MSAVPRQNRSQKTVKPDKYGQSEYLCRKCHKPYFFTVPSPSVAYMSARENKNSSAILYRAEYPCPTTIFFESNALCHQKSLQQTVYILFHDLPRNRELKLAAARKIPLFPYKIRHFRRIQVFQIISRNFFAKKQSKDLTSNGNYAILHLACGRGGTGRRVRLRGVWETVWVQVPSTAPTKMTCTFIVQVFFCKGVRDLNGT